MLLLFNLLNVDQYEKGMLLVKELTADCPNADFLECCVMKLEVSVMWPCHPVINTDLCTRALDKLIHIDALDGTHHNEAAVNSTAFSPCTKVWRWRCMYSEM